MYGSPSRVGNLAAAGSINTLYSLGRVTHLLFASNLTAVDADKLSVTLRQPDDPEEVVINNVSLLALTGISDYQGGFSSSLQSKITSEAGATDYVGFFYAVDLGNLDLRSTNSDLAISVTWSQAGSLFVSAVAWKPDGPDYVLRTIEQAVLSANAMDVDAIFVYYATGTDAPITDAALNDVNVTVESDVEGSANCTLQDCMAMTAAMGEIEANSPRNIICIYQNLDDVPDNVRVQLSGSDADSDLRLIVQSRRYVTNRLLKNAVGIVERVAKKMSKYGNEKQVALNMANVAAPAETLHKNVQVLRGVRDKVIKVRTGK